MKLRAVARRFSSSPRTLAGAVTATVATAVAGSVATDVDGRWYRRRELPSWQPPGIAFPIVWTALYADIAVTSAATLTKLDRESPAQARRFSVALGTNLALNASWTALFFRVRRPSIATAGALVLAVSSADLARRAGAADGVLGGALAPYAVWCTFATALSADIWRLNGDG